MHKAMSKQNKKNRAETDQSREPMAEAVSARKEPEDTPKPEMKAHDGAQKAHRKER